jgi:hypothetical protein
MTLFVNDCSSRVATVTPWNACVLHPRVFLLTFPVAGTEIIVDPTFSEHFQLPVKDAVYGDFLVRP